MTWFNVLKMPNPFGGKWDTLTSSEYYTMDDNNKRLYHKSMAMFYSNQVKRAVTPRKAGQAPPATDDQIRGLRELSRFHSRQLRRLQLKLTRENYYSLDEEENRQMRKPIYDAVERMPHTTKEMYDNFTREDKIKYWVRTGSRLRENYGTNHPKYGLSYRMYERMKTNPNYNPPFEGDNSSLKEYRDKYRHRDVNEYDDFTDNEKLKYHARMKHRTKDSSHNFHARMEQRIRLNLNQPTYPTPEAEREAEE